MRRQVIAGEIRERVGRRTSAPARPGEAARHDDALQSCRAVGNSVATERAQAKLAVGSPGDRYEQEADQVADRVAGNAAQEGIAPSATSAIGVMRKGDSEGIEVDASVVHDGVRGGGAPLDATTREFMETRFGHDFGSVRVHTGEAADVSARAVNARGYTVGGDIVFAANEYAPHTGAGRWLLAHELAHVVQQGGASPSRQNAADGGSRSMREGAPSSRQGGASPVAGSLSSARPGTVQRVIPTPGYRERQANAPRIAEMRHHIEAMRARMAEPRYAPIRAQALAALDTAAAVIDHYEHGVPRPAGATPVVGLAGSYPVAPVAPTITPTTVGGMGITPLGAGVAIGIGVISLIWGGMSTSSAPSFTEVESAMTRLDEVLDQAIQTLPAPAPAIGRTPVTPPVTTTTQPNPSGSRSLVADSNIFMDRQNPGDILPVAALLASPGTTLYVPDAAWNEVLSGDRHGTQAPRLRGIPGGATIIHDLDGTLTGIPPAALVPSRTFNTNDMKIVQRAKERPLPLVTVNGAMATQIQGSPARMAQWGMVPIIRP